MSFREQYLIRRIFELLLMHAAISNDTHQPAINSKFIIPLRQRSAIRKAGFPESF